MRFDNARYTVNEDDGLVQPVLVLSNPSSFVVSLQVITTDVTANGMIIADEIANGKICTHDDMTVRKV